MVRISSTRGGVKTRFRCFKVTGRMRLRISRRQPTRWPKDSATRSVSLPRSRGLPVAEDTNPSRRPLAGVCAAGLVLAVSIAWGVTGLRARDGAQRDVARMQAAITSTRREDARLVARLTRAQAM